MLFRLTLVERALHRFRLLPVPVMDAFASVLFGRALAISIRAGLFDALRDRSLSTGEIARGTGLHPDGVALLVEAFVQGGYLKRVGTSYALTMQGRKWLLSDSRHSIAKLIGYFETLHVRWGSLEGALRNGGPVAPYYESFNDHDWEIYVHGMRELARFLSPGVMAKVVIPRSASRLLDIGGSHGLYAIACCRCSAQLTATVVDFDGPLRWTRQFIREAGLEGRVVTLAGDFLSMELPKGQDVALLFNVIHGLRDDQNRILIGRLLDTLVPGGKLYILDQMRGAMGRSQLARFIPLMVGLNLLNEIGGTAYSIADVQRWCAGAKKIRRRKMRIPGVTLVEVVV
jgi:SAM-dependent methyltransferase